MAPGSARHERGGVMRVPAEGDVSRLVAALDPRDPFAGRDRAMLVLASHTGLRVSELVGLDVDHVASAGVPRRALHLPSALGKGARERVIPLNGPAREAVQALLAFNVRRGFSVAPDAPLFVTRKHERVSVRLVQRLLEVLRERADLDVPLTPHSLRHGFATELMQACGNLRVVQKILGHVSIRSTQVYTHPTPADLEKAVATLAERGCSVCA